MKLKITACDVDDIHQKWSYVAEAEEGGLIGRIQSQANPRLCVAWGSPGLDSGLVVTYCYANLFGGNEPGYDPEACLHQYDYSAQDCASCDEDDPFVCTGCVDPNSSLDELGNCECKFGFEI